MAIRDLSKLPRAEVDRLRAELAAAFLPGGDFDRGLLAQRRLRELVDAQPLTTHAARAEISFRIPRKGRGGRRRGSKVVNGHVVPPPVTVDLTKTRVTMAPPDPWEVRLLDEERTRDWWRRRMV